MGHLRLAEKLLPHFPDLDPGQFAYGSLAPDFGKPVDDGKFYPLKEISHLLIKIEGQPVFQDLLFFQKYLSENTVKNDIPRYSFLMGYFFHLTSDGLWHEWIGKASKRDYGDLIEELVKKSNSLQRKLADGKIIMPDSLIKALPTLDQYIGKPSLRVADDLISK